MTGMQTVTNRRAQSGLCALLLSMEVDVEVAAGGAHPAQVALACHPFCAPWTAEGQLGNNPMVTRGWRAARGLGSGSGRAETELRAPLARGFAVVVRASACFSNGTSCGVAAIHGWLP